MVPESRCKGGLFFLQVFNEGVVALVVHNAIKLVSVIRDDTYRIDGHVVDLPAAALLLHAKIQMDRLLTLAHDISIHLPVVAAVQGRSNELDLLAAIVV